MRHPDDASRHDSEPDALYIFTTNGGAPTNPDWHYNLTVIGGRSVECGIETYQVTAPQI